MPDLSFQIEGAEAVANSATPLLALNMRVTNVPATESIHSVNLRCQVQIQPTLRRYAAPEQEKLLDLFGTPDRWSRTVRAMHWMNTSVAVTGFSGTTVVKLELPCTFDFNVAATKYFHALDAGEIPLCVMFSGTIFYNDSSGSLQVTQVPWDREAVFRLPISVWKEMMDAHYPNSAWLCLHRDAFERLYEYKVRHGIPTWEQALERILDSQEKSLESSEVEA